MQREREQKTGVVAAEIVMGKLLLVNNFARERSYTGVSKEEGQVEGFERRTLPLRSTTPLQDDC